MTERITMVEVAARDGLQSDPAQVSTAAKLELIDRALHAGLRRIEVTSFVNPARVPQMADADDVMAELRRRREDPATSKVYGDGSFIGLVLNRRGAERALAAGCDELNAVVPVSDTFAERNQGTDTAGAIDVWAQVAAMAADAGVPASVTLTTSFGCPYEGEIPLIRLTEVALRCVEAGGSEAALADTIGVAVPTDVEERVAVLRDAITRAGSGQALRAHFHNTRNTAVACVAAAVGAGVPTIDASLGGIGGCPFAPNATGNVATEDVVYLLERMGYDTGVDLDALVATAAWMQTPALLDHPVPGLVARAGVWPGSLGSS
ncbi:MAG: hydroxymethylglutaryl-CoA lyase [Microthrixaceae bacterium]